MISFKKWYGLKVAFGWVVLLFCTIFCFANFSIKSNNVALAENNMLYSNWYNSLQEVNGGSIIISGFDSSKKLSIAKAINSFTEWGLTPTMNALNTLPLTIELDGHDQSSINTLLQKLNNYGVSYTSGGVKLESIIFSDQVSPGTDGLQIGDHLYGFLNQEKTVLTIYAEDGGTIYAPQNCSRLFASLEVSSIIFNNFDTSKVTDMSEMFALCSNIENLDISGFNFAKVRNMSSMFKEMTKLSQISFAPQLTVNDMSYMFADCSNLTEVKFLSSVGGLTNLRNMFSGCVKLNSVQVNNFNTSSVTSFNSVFSGCISLSQLNISNWSFRSSTSVSNFLQGCEKLSVIQIDASTLGSSKIVLPKVFAVGSEIVSEISSQDVIYGDVYYTVISLPSTWASIITSKIAGFNPSEINFINSDQEITGQNKIVEGIGFNYDQDEKILDIFSNSVIVSPDSMLNFIPKNLIWLEQVNFENFTLNATVTSLTSLFEKDTISNQKAIPLVVTFGDYFDTKKVTNMSKMFYMVHRLTAVNFGSRFITNNVTDMSNMFYNCRKLTRLDVSNFNTTKVTTMQNMFYNCEKLTQLDVSNFDTSNVMDMQNMFGGLNEIQSLDVSNFNTTKVTSMQYMFGDCRKLTRLDVSGFDTTNVTNMSSMFSGCELLENLDVSGFNTSKVTNMCCMFNCDRALKNLDVSNFNTSKVEDFSYMFSDCKSLTYIDVLNFDTSKAEDISGMFCGCAITNIDISSFDLSNCIYLSEFFAYNSNLETVNISGLNTSNIKNFDCMFSNCYRLTSIIGIEDLDTSNGTNFYGMFNKAYSLRVLNLSKWDVRKAEYMSHMFEMSECEEYNNEPMLEYLDISSWELISLDKKHGTEDIFKDSDSLKTIILPFMICDIQIALPGDYYVVDLVNIEQETADIYNTLVEYEYNRSILQKCGTLYYPLMPDAGIELSYGYTTYIIGAVLVCIVATYMVFICTKTKRRYK